MPRCVTPQIAGRPVADRYGIELDGVEVLPQLIMQFERQMLAIGLLDPQGFFGERAVGGERLLESAPRPRAALESLGALAGCGARRAI